MPKGRTQRHHEARLIASSHVSESRPDVGHLDRIVEGVFGTGKAAGPATAGSRRPRARALKRPPLCLGLNGRQSAFESHDRQEAVEAFGELLLHGDLRKTLPQIAVIAHD